jgi:hypothetical protein
MNIERENDTNADSVAKMFAAVLVALAKRHLSAARNDRGASVSRRSWVSGGTR